MTAFLLVRAEVDPAVRDAFDTWYQEEHLRRVAKACGAAGAWRGWSAVDDNVHVACYEFANLADVNRVTASAERKNMLGEFARRWQGKASWTREVVESVQAIWTAVPSHLPVRPEPWRTLRSLARPGKTSLEEGGTRASSRPAPAGRGRR